MSPVLSVPPLSFNNCGQRGIGSSCNKNNKPKEGDNLLTLPNKNSIGPKGGKTYNEERLPEYKRPTGNPVEGYSLYNGLTNEQILQLISLS